MKMTSTNYTLLKRGDVFRFVGEEMNRTVHFTMTVAGHKGGMGELPDHTYIVLADGDIIDFDPWTPSEHYKEYEILRKTKLSKIKNVALKD